MRKRVLVLAVCLCLLAASALADMAEGTVQSAGNEIQILSTADATLESVSAWVGEEVSAGDELAQLKATPVFATQDGTVVNVTASVGDSVSDTVVEIFPDYRYEIYCTVDKAYSSPETTLVHSGESVYIKCTKNGTHRATGMITSIDDNDYQVITTGGELYVGETVYLYRDAAFSSNQRIGIGTVVTADTEAYTATGKLTSLKVEIGDHVERGELLFTYAGSSELTLASPVDGIITAVSASAGDSVRENQAVVTVCPLDDLCVEISVSEEAMDGLTPGMSVTVIYAGDTEETEYPATVTHISSLSEDGTYTVRIKPDDCSNLRIGQNVSVFWSAE